MRHFPSASLITVQENDELTILSSANQLINEMEVFEFEISNSG